MRQTNAELKDGRKTKDYVNSDQPDNTLWIKGIG